MNERISASDALQEPWITKYVSEKIEISDKDLLLSLKNLKNFRIHTSFQAAVLSYITSQQMSKAEESKIRQIFDSYDKDKSGQLTKDELIDVLRYLHGDCKRIYKEADEIFSNIDLDNNGTIEYNGIFNIILEFLVANMRVASILNEENLRKAFEFYDDVTPFKNQDHNGQITYEEIKKVFGGVCDENILKQTINEIDVDHDNQVTFYDRRFLFQNS